MNEQSIKFLLISDPPSHPAVCVLVSGNRGGVFSSKVAVTVEFYHAQLYICFVFFLSFLLLLFFFFPLPFSCSLYSPLSFPLYTGYVCSV